MTFVDSGARQPVNIEVRLRGGQGFNPDNDLPEWKPAAPAQGSSSQFDPDALPEWSPPTKQPEPQAPEMGGAESAWRGVLNSASSGAVPAIEGLGAAAGPEWHQSQAAHDFAPIVGAAKMLHSYISGHPDDQVRKDYEEGRKKAESEEKQAGKSWWYTAGQVLGGLVTPAFGALKAGSVGARAAYGALAGAVGGGLYGAGSGISAGEDIPNIARGAGVGAALGGAMGGVGSAALGPRINPVGLTGTSGQRAATTAADLGAPLPRGLASDNATVQATTAKMRSIPGVGSLISGKVDKTAKAAGKRIADITDTMASGATSRAAADTLLRPALQDVIDNNNSKADALYSGLRGMINPDRPYALPRTDRALNEIMAARKAAGWANPAQGLEQFRNVAGRGSFNGAHRARVDARNAGNVLNPNPGYNAADFNKITRALTADLRDVVHTEGGPAALSAFSKAETEFGKIAEQNSLLHKLVNSKASGGAIATLLGAAGKSAANVKILADLKAQMPAADFQNIGGVLLHELAANPTTGEFSLAKFVTNWNKVGDQAKRILFSPSHLKSIEDIVGLGEHIKGSLKESNTSHTAGVIIAVDVLKDIALTVANLGGGSIGAKEVAAGAATTAAPAILGMWLASPAKAASMSAWAKAYRGVSGSPTPARMAVFNVATRNLANNLGVPAKKILERAAAAQPQDQNAQP